MANTIVGAGRATGMAYRAPKGTALPSTPGEALAADWEEIGSVGEDGITMTLPNGDVLRNWALVAERKINTENGKIQVPFISTDEKSLGACFGSNNVTTTAADASHGNINSVTLSPDVSAEPCAWLFLMKDGDTLGMIGTSDGLVTEIADVAFNASNAITWNTTIDATWTVAFDDGQVI